MSGDLIQRMLKIAAAAPEHVRRKAAVISACGARGTVIGGELAGGIDRCEWTGASRDRCADLGTATHRALRSLNRVLAAVEGFMCEYAAVLEGNQDGARRALELWAASRMQRAVPRHFVGPGNALAAVALAWAADQLARCVDAAVTRAAEALERNLAQCRSLMDQALEEFGRAMRTIEADARFIGTVNAGTTFIEYDDSDASEVRDEIAASAAIWNRSLRNVKLLRGGPDSLLHYTVDDLHTGIESGPGGVVEVPRGSFGTTGEVDDNRIVVHPDIAAYARVSPTRLFTHETGHFLGLDDNYGTTCTNLMSGGDFTERSADPNSVCRSATPTTAEAREIDRLWALPPANLWEEGVEVEHLEDRPRFIKGLLRLEK
ncbi:MAG: snapalysin family zinc-dependent metalloprotease [Nocardioides sp.]